MKFRMWWRSAITGRFVKQQEAASSPETTMREKSNPIIWYDLICDVCGKKAGQAVSASPFQVVSIVCSGCINTDPLQKVSSQIWDGKIWYPLGAPE